MGNEFVVSSIADAFFGDMQLRKREVRRLGRGRWGCARFGRIAGTVNELRCHRVGAQGGGNGTVV